MAAELMQIFSDPADIGALERRRMTLDIARRVIAIGDYIVVAEIAAVVAIAREQPIGIFRFARVPGIGSALAQRPRAEPEDGQGCLTWRRARRVKLTIHMRRENRTRAKIAIAKIVEDSAIGLELCRREVDERDTP